MLYLSLKYAVLLNVVLSTLVFAIIAPWRYCNSSLITHLLSFNTCPIETWLFEPIFSFFLLSFCSYCLSHRLSGFCAMATLLILSTKEVSILLCILRIVLNVFSNGIPSPDILYYQPIDEPTSISKIKFVIDSSI